MTSLKSNIFVTNDIEDMKTFKDLNFNIFEDGLKQAYGVSVLSGDGSLSENNHPYEIAVIMFERCGTFAVVYPYFCNDDVLSFKTEEDVSFYMQLIQRLHPEGY